MPPFIPLPDGAQVEIFYHLGGVTIENRLWFLDRQPPITQAHLDNLAAGVDAWVQTSLLPFLSIDLTYVGVLATKWDDHVGDLISEIHTSVAGGNISSSMSANVAVRVAFNAADPELFRRNSNFVPGIAKDDVLLNTYSSALRDALHEAYSAIIDLAAGWGPFPAWRWVVTSRRADNDWRTEQLFRRADGPLFPSPYVSPRRHRLT